MPAFLRLKFPLWRTLWTQRFKWCLTQRTDFIPHSISKHLVKLRFYVWRWASAVMATLSLYTRAHNNAKKFKAGVRKKTINYWITFGQIKGGRPVEMRAPAAAQVLCKQFNISWDPTTIFPLIDLVCGSKPFLIHLHSHQKVSN